MQDIPDTDYVTGDWLDAVVAAIKELQSMAVRAAIYPLDLNNGVMTASLPPVMMRVQNTLADNAVINPFDVVGLGDPLSAVPTDLTNSGLTDYNWKPGFKGVLPVNDHDRFAVVLALCPNGAVAAAVLMGVVTVQVDMQEETDKYAYCQAGEKETLFSTAIPNDCEILSVPLGTGVQWAMVRIGPQPGVSLKQCKVTDPPALGGGYATHFEGDIVDGTSTADGWTARVFWHPNSEGTDGEQGPLPYIDVDMQVWYVETSCDYTAKLSTGVLLGNYMMPVQPINDTDKYKGLYLDDTGHWTIDFLREF